MKKAFFLLPVSAFLLLIACGGGATSNPSGTDNAQSKEAASASGNPSYDPNRGEGKFKNVEIPAGLDGAKATAGEKVYNVKCSSCHKLTDEKLVGPGWKGVTSRHTADWIMNFATNTDAMLDKDPKAQAMLEICLVRMPNQNLSDEDARNIYEYMRKNDGIK
ncbi:MAG: cytochrome c [Sphingobacteriia bacterium]|nr:cytochrome c [Sphingobacteriia bacterium]